jgi:hypothetical protein
VRLLGGHEEKGNQGGVPADSGLHREGGIAAGGGVMGSGGGGVRWGSRRRVKEDVRWEVAACIGKCRF